MELGGSLPHSQQSNTCLYLSQINPILCPSHFGLAQLVSFLVGLRTYQHPVVYETAKLCRKAHRTYVSPNKHSQNLGATWKFYLQFQTYELKKKNFTKIKRVTYQLHTEFLPARNEKLNETNTAGEYCWAITQAAGPSCCGRFQSVGVWVSTAVPCIYSAHTVHHMHTWYRLAQNSTYVVLFQNLTSTCRNVCVQFSHKIYQLKYRPSSFSPLTEIRCWAR